MTLKFNVSETEELMKSFYLMTGIKVALFDSNFNEIITYPKENCDFCRIMRSCPKTKRKCNYADRKSFENCKASNSLVVYKCHAGLVEAVAPLHENEKNIGYLMFGQITDSKSKDFLFKMVPSWSEKYGFSQKELLAAMKSITYKSEEQIRAAAKIMEACTSYIAYKELITPETNRIFESAKAYIEEHLCEDFSISDICSSLNVGRTKLYEIFKSEADIGISEYLRRRRMHRAKKLLKTTDLSIPQIARAVGINDYNYFSRIYKKIYKKSPKSYRK